MGEGPPLVFETMTFPKFGAGGKGAYEADVCERYATWDEAVAGHARVLASVLAGEAPRT